MQPENIKTRISIGREEAGDIAYIYDYNLLKILNIPEDNFFNGEYFLDIGSEFELNDENFRIKTIRTVFHDHTFDMESKPLPGVNAYSIGEQLNFNFEIMYFVEDIV